MLPGSTLRQKMLLVAAGLAAGVVAGVLAFELICRCCGWGALQRAGDGFKPHDYPGQFRPAHNLRLGWEFDPAYASVNRAGFAINSLGFLGREYPLAKAADTYRIVAIGDSITADGWYAKYLEERLNAAGLPMKFEVWNCGVPGYGVDQYYQAMLEKVPLFNPDLVIVGFCLNDFCELPVVMRDRRGYLTAFNNPVGDVRIGRRLWSANRTLFFSSYAYRFLACTLRDHVARGHGTERHFGADRVARITGYAASRRIKLLGLIFPLLKSRYSGYEKQQLREIRDALAGYRMECIDLHGRFPGIDDPAWRSYGPSDEIHPSETGHRIAAETVFNYLIRNRARWLESGDGG